MDDSEDDVAAMAAAMGFSSFGAQNPNKRRKFNPNTDAFVASNSSAASTLPIHRHGSNRKTTTGSNNVPLGTRRQNVDEIQLDSDEDDQQLPPGASAAPTNDDKDEDPQPQYLDASSSSLPIDADSDNIQSKIDGIVAGTPGENAFPQASSSLPGGGHPAQGGFGTHNYDANQDGQRKPWWEGYYDPSSLINPWERLEKSHGLEPCGTWMSWEEAKAAKP